MARFPADEHVPGPFLAALRALGHDVVRAKDELEEGSVDHAILAFARRDDRIVLTCDRRFTVVDGAVIDDHAGVIYATQPTLRARPEEAASGVDRVATTVSANAFTGCEFYLRAWL